MLHQPRDGRPDRLHARDHLFSGLRSPGTHGANKNRHRNKDERNLIYQRRTSTRRMGLLRSTRNDGGLKRHPNAKQLLLYIYGLFLFWHMHVKRTCSIWPLYSVTHSMTYYTRSLWKSHEKKYRRMPSHRNPFPCFYNTDNYAQKQNHKCPCKMDTRESISISWPPP